MKKTERRGIMILLVTMMLVVACASSQATNYNAFKTLEKHGVFMAIYNLTEKHWMFLDRNDQTIKPTPDLLKAGQTFLKHQIIIVVDMGPIGWIVKDINMNESLIPKS